MLRGGLMCVRPRLHYDGLAYGSASPLAMAGVRSLTGLAKAAS